MHQTARVHEAVVSEDFADYSEGERVHTVDGIGRVVAFEDGPFPGTESYQIELEGGRGGGWYSSREVYSSAGMTQASGVHTATDDYPELQDILWRRPDIAREP
jgi:hypothetical protein